MSLKQYRAFYSFQCRRIKTQVKHINVKCLSVKLINYRNKRPSDIYSPTYSACVFLVTWATMKDTVIVAIESNSFEFTV